MIFPSTAREAGGLCEHSHSSRIIKLLHNNTSLKLLLPLIFCGARFKRFHLDSKFIKGLIRRFFFFISFNLKRSISFVSIAVFKHGEVVSQTSSKKNFKLRWIHWEKNIRSNLTNFSWIHGMSRVMRSTKLSLSLSSKRLFVFGNWNWGMKKITYLFIQFFSVPFYSRKEELKFKIYRFFIVLSKRFPNFSKINLTSCYFNREYNIFNSKFGVRACYLD